MEIAVYCSVCSLVGLLVTIHEHASLNIYRYYHTFKYAEPFHNLQTCFTTTDDFYVYICLVRMVQFIQV